jgi:hypothetical protein
MSVLKNVILAAYAEKDNHDDFWNTDGSRLSDYMTKYHGSFTTSLITLALDSSKRDAAAQRLRTANLLLEFRNRCKGKSEVLIRAMLKY